MPYLHLTYSKRIDQRESGGQFQFINIRNQSGSEEEKLGQTSVSSLQKAPKGNEIHNLGPATEKQESKCLCRFVNPDCKDKKTIP